MTNLVMTPPKAPARRDATSAPAARTTLGARLTFLGLAISALLMAYLHIVASGQLRLLDTTMSDYVFADHVGWMFPVSVLSMSVAGVGVMYGLARTGLLAGVLLRLSLGLAAAGALLAAVFPTDLGESLSLSAQIHRYAAGVVFFSLPLAAFLVARRLTRDRSVAGYRNWLYANVSVSTLVLTLFLASHFGMMPEAVQDLGGLFQRLLFAAEIALLAQLAYLPLLRRASNRRATLPRHPAA